MGLNEWEQKEYEEKGVKKKDLVDGAYYRGGCRNASVARWNAAMNQFYYIRTKWGDEFVETLPGPEDAIDGMDYFLPEAMEPNPTEEIRFEDNIRGANQRWDKK